MFNPDVKIIYRIKLGLKVFDSIHIKLTLDVKTCPSLNIRILVASVSA